MILSILLFLVGLIIFLAVVVFEIRSLADLFNVARELTARNCHFLSALFQVDEESRSHGGSLVADVLKSHGVEHIFTLCGGHISPILVACEAKNIRVVDTRHEVSAVFAADASARLTQGIGVVAVTAGPGLTNTVTAIKNAQMAESPVLLLGGAAATILKGRGALQDIDQMVLFRPLCKYTATISRVKDIVPTLRAAIHAAKSGTPGPVFVEFPIDTLYPYHIIHKELGVKPGTTSIFQKIVNFYLQFHISRLFGNAWAYRTVDPIEPNIPEPNQQQVAEAARIILNSKQPLLLIGSQALLPPVTPEKLRQTVEELGIPSFLGGMARGLLGRKGRLQIRQERKTALKEADVVILAGTVADFRLSYGRVLSRKSKIIVINRSKTQMLKNSDAFWKPTVAVNSDVAHFLVNLHTELKKHQYRGPPDEGWLKSLRDRDEAKEEKNHKMGAEQPEQHLNPIKVMEELEKTLPENAIIVADGGDFVGTAAYTLRPRGPLQWLDPGAFGTLGVGGGFALGAKICRPNSPVWIIYGDGSFGYSLAEFDSYQRHKTPVTAVIGNDACWSQIVREQLPMFGSAVGCHLEYTPYEEVVRGFGATGLKLGRDNETEAEDIFRKADEENSNKKSVCINVLIGKSKFREGSISV